MRDAGSPRRSGSESGSMATPDDDKYNKPRRPDAEEPRLWLGMPVSVLKERMGVLAVLMVLQSASGAILSVYEEMLQKHVVVTLFLTMLVGAGGNAGNQSTVNIIRGLATGQVNTSNYSSVVLVESKLGIVLGIVLATLAWARVMITSGDAVSAMAIGAPRSATASGTSPPARLTPACLIAPWASCSCASSHPGASVLCIVAISTVVGAVLPIVLHRSGIDAAHAGPAIQVLMDIVGVTITCVICAQLFTYYGVQ